MPTNECIYRFVAHSCCYLWRLKLTYGLNYVRQAINTKGRRFNQLKRRPFVYCRNFRR